MAKIIKICLNLGGWKKSTFGSVYKVSMSSLLPSWQKISKFAEIFGHGKGQLLALHIMFLSIHHHLHCEKKSKFAEILGHGKSKLLAHHTMFHHLYYHPQNKKYPNLLKSCGMERVNFLLSVRYDVFMFSLSTPWGKISKYAEILGHRKGQYLALHTLFLHFQYHPHGENYPNLLKSWWLEKVNFWLSIQCFYVFTIILYEKISKFAKILGHGKILLLAQGTMLAFTITPMAKNIQICWNLGAWKVSTFGLAYNVFMSSLSPPLRKTTKFAKILGHGKIQLLAQGTMIAFTITPMAKNIQICWNLGGWKKSTFGSAYNVSTSSLLPCWQKISKFAEIFEHGKGQLLALCTMFLLIQQHPHDEKYPNLLKSSGMERFNFWLRVRWLPPLSPPWQKISKFAEILGHRKGQYLA